MKRIVYFLVVLLNLENCFSSCVESVASKLEPFSDKISVNMLKSFISRQSVLTDKSELEARIEIVAKGEDKASFSQLAYDFQSGWVHSGKNFGSVLFNNSQSNNVAVFLLAGVVLLQYKVIQNVFLIQYALEVLRLSIVGGSKEISKLLGENSESVLNAVLDLTKESF